MKLNKNLISRYKEENYFSIWPSKVYDLQCKHIIQGSVTETTNAIFMQSNAFIRSKSDQLTFSNMCRGTKSRNIEKDSTPERETSTPIPNVFKTDQSTPRPNASNEWILTWMIWSCGRCWIRIPGSQAQTSSEQYSFHILILVTVKVLTRNNFYHAYNMNCQAYTQDIKRNMDIACLMCF